MKWNIYISGFKIRTFENNRKEVLCAGLGYSLLSKSLIQPLLLNQLCFSFQSHVHDHAGCTESRCRDSDQLHVGTIQERFTCTKRISLTHWLIRRVDIYFFFFFFYLFMFLFLVYHIILPNNLVQTIFHEKLWNFKFFSTSLFYNWCYLHWAKILFASNTLKLDNEHLGHLRKLFFDLFVPLSNTIILLTEEEMQALFRFWK